MNYTYCYEALFWLIIEQPNLAFYGAPRSTNLGFEFWFYPWGFKSGAICTGRGSIFFRFTWEICLGRHTLIYLYLYIHRNICSWRNIYIHNYMNMYLYIYIYTHCMCIIYTYTHVCTCIRGYTCRYMLIHTYTCMYMHACMHACMHTYIHTYIDP